MFEPVLELIDSAAAYVNGLDVDWLKLILTTLVAGFVFEQYIDWRQYTFLATATIPEEVKAFKDADTFEKSTKYSRAKLRFGMIASVLSLAVDLAIYYYRITPAFYAHSVHLLSLLGIKWLRTEMAAALVFNILLSGLVAVIKLPMSWYKTFVLEEKFGFNKQTQGIFFSDFVKSQLIGAVLNSVFLVLFTKVYDWFGKMFFVYATLLVLGFIVLMMVLYPTVIQPLFNKLTPLEEGELRMAVNNLAARLNFPLKRIYVEDGSKRSAHSNAYFTGMPWYKQIVIFDTLIDQCTTQEITAVLSHELGHWSLGHIPKNVSITSFLVLTTFAFFAVFIENTSLYSAVGFDKAPPLAVRLNVFMELIAPFSALVQFFMSYITRKFEYEADDFAASLGYGEDLEKALVILSNKNLSEVTADKLYSTYHYSHPILPERLSALRKAMQQHKKKVQ